MTTLEVNPDKIVMARKNLAQASVADLVDIREGRAAETLAVLPGPFDVAFLDADRPSYATYLELVEEGREALEEIRDAYARTLEAEQAEAYEQAFNRQVVRHLPRFGLGLEDA